VRWQSAFIFLLSVALIAWFLSGVDLHDLERVLARAHAAWIGAGVGSVLVTYLFRAWRWQVLLAPIVLGASGLRANGTGQRTVSFRNSFRVTVMGFTATNLLPGRLGEILRPYLIARVEPVSAPAALATILIERLLDLSAIMLLFGVFLATTATMVSADLKWVGASASGAAVLSLGLLIFGAGHPVVLRRWSDALTTRLPARIAGVAGRFAHTLVDGLLVMRQPRAVTVAAALSICLWLSIALTIWCSALALDLTFAFPDTFLIVMYLVVGVAVPVPSGVGSYHFMYQLAVTSIFHVNRDVAAAAAIVTHAVSFLPISVLGVVYLAQDGWTLARLRNVQSDGGRR
jgi:uncharacterized protein (TIRG00374 family)